MEQKEIQWKKQSEELAEVDKKLVLAENKKQEADAVLQEIKDVRVLGNQAEQCRKNAIKTRENYAKITEKYNAVNTEYEEVRLYFLNAQAGFLAAELEPGKPCPVCGSKMCIRDSYSLYLPLYHKYRSRLYLHMPLLAASLEP